MIDPRDGRTSAATVDITIMVSCYNEETTIAPTLRRLVSALRGSPLAAEIVVMDDRSQDGSVEAVRRFIADLAGPTPIVRHHINEINRGLVWNVFEAASLGRGKYFWVVGGDDALNPEVYDALLPAVGTADVIIPNVLSYHGRPIHRWALSRLYVWIVNTLSGYSIRYYNGSSIYLRTDVTSNAYRVKGFGYSAELIVALLDQGRSYRVVDVVFNDRTAGRSSAVTAGNLREVIAFFGRLLLRRLRGRAVAADVAPQPGPHDVLG